MAKDKKKSGDKKAVKAAKAAKQEKKAGAKALPSRPAPAPVKTAVAPKTKPAQDSGSSSESESDDEGVDPMALDTAESAPQQSVVETQAQAEM